MLKLLAPLVGAFFICAPALADWQAGIEATNVQTGERIEHRYEDQFPNKDVCIGAVASNLQALLENARNAGFTDIAPFCVKAGDDEEEELPPVDCEHPQDPESVLACGVRRMFDIMNREGGFGHQKSG